MIKNLHMKAFRGLDEVRLDELGQFNVIVGPGNVGKTNLLESMFLFCGNGDPFLLLKILGLRRIEAQDLSPKEVIAYVDWFWTVGKKDLSFEIAGEWDDRTRTVRVSKIDQDSELAITTGQEGNAKVDSAAALAVYRTQTHEADAIHTGDLIVQRESVKIKKPSVGPIPARFVSPGEIGLSRPIAAVWSEVEEDGNRERVLTLLKGLDPEIVDIRVRADELGRASVRIHHDRLGMMPTECLGAGFGKALAIVCHLSRIRNGLFLIDEFDASMHIGAQTSLIEFIMKAAEENNVQICVSTHSLETLDAFLDGFSRLPSLFTKPNALRVLQVKRTAGKTQINSLDMEKAKRLREDVGLDLRRTG